MQERAGGGHHDPVGTEPGRRPFQQPQRPLQIAPPHVAAVDHAQREHHVLRHEIQSPVQLLRRPNQVEMHRRHGQPQRRRQVLAQVAEVGRQANPDLIRRRTQPRAGRLQRAQCLLGQVQRQGRLVDLHPVGPGVGQPPQHLFIDRQQLVQQPQRLRFRRFAPAQQEKRQRPQQHGPGVDAQRRRLQEMIDRLGRGELELHARLELGHKVVVVRVEPLGHVQGRDFVGAPGHGEVRRRIDRSARPREPLRHGPQHRRRVEHVVEQREVAGGDVLDAQRLLQPPVFAAEPGGRGLKLFRVQIARPILLHRPLQLPAGAKAGKSQVCGNGHPTQSCMGEEAIRMVCLYIGIVKPCR